MKRRDTHVSQLHAAVRRRRSTREAHAHAGTRRCVDTAAGHMIALTVEQVREGLSALGVLDERDERASCPVCDGLMTLTVRANGNGAHVECSAGCKPDEIVGALRSGLVQLTRQQVLAQQAGEPTITFVSTLEMRDQTPVEPEWLWNGYVARGAITLLAGKPKAGKSTLLCALVEALAEGAGEFLGRAVTNGPVIYVSEEGAGTLIAKLPATENVRVLSRDAVWPRPTWEQVVDAAVAEAKRVGAGLLVLDSFAFWAGLAEGSENDAGATQLAVARLVPATAAGLGVVLVHHQRKSGGEGGDAIRGSNAIAGAVDTLVEIERPDEKGPPGNRRLYAVGRWASTPQVLMIDRDAATCSWRATGTAADRQAANAAGKREMILDALPAAAPGVTRAEIEEATGRNYRDVQAPLAELVESGAVIRTGPGVANHPFRWYRAVDGAAGPPTSGLGPEPLMVATEPRSAILDFDQAA
jgi:hypothetical protein